jgi:hypothetical protein
VKLTRHFQPAPRSGKRGSLCPLPIRFHRLVLNLISTGSTLSYKTYQYIYIYIYSYVIFGTNFFCLSEFSNSDSHKHHPEFLS